MEPATPIKKTIPVRVDRSHLITIGRRLYSQSLELIRELVNNAYDADATEVRITIREDEIEVADNGSGMDLAGLEQYFNIGSQEKLYRDISPKFKRQRIGQFGIGKFAGLSAADRFEVWTKRGDFSARVVFDRKDWERGGEEWSLPLETFPGHPGRPDGTRVVLSQVTKKLDPFKVERKVIESVPIKAPSFAVYVNDSRVRAVRVPGRKLPFLEGTEFGLVHGEIILASLPRPEVEEVGIEIKVKGVTVRRDLFGMERWGRAAERIMGEIHADFLPGDSCGCPEIGSARCIPLDLICFCIISHMRHKERVVPLLYLYSKGLHNRQSEIDIRSGHQGTVQVDFGRIPDNRSYEQQGGEILTAFRGREYGFSAFKAMRLDFYRGATGFFNAFCLGSPDL